MLDELKVRLLPRLYREDAAARAYLLKQSRRRRRDQAEGQVSDVACRADRLEFAFRFEEQSMAVAGLRKRRGSLLQFDRDRFRLAVERCRRQRQDGDGLRGGGGQRFEP